jgi:hypothetical protein
MSRSLCLCRSRGSSIRKHSDRGLRLGVDEPHDGFAQRLFEALREPIVNCETETLVFGEGARKLPDRARQSGPKRSRQLDRARRRRRWPTRVEAHLRAVDPARTQAQRLEQTIEIVNGAAANQGHGASEVAFSLRQGRHKSGGRRNFMRPFGEVEQSAVDVEKQGDRPVARGCNSRLQSATPG